MSMKQIDAAKGPTFTVMWGLFSCAVGWMYGGFDGAVVGLVSTMLLSALSALGLIPGLGPVMYYLLVKEWLMPAVLGWVGFQWASLTSLLFSLFFAVSVYYTFASSIVILTRHLRHVEKTEG